MLARHGDVGNFFQKRHVAARHTTRKKRPRHTVFVCLFANIIQNRPPAHRKRPRHTVFVCLFADIIQNHPPAHRTCRQRRRRGAAAAAALLRPLPLLRRLPPMTTMTWCRFLLYPRKWPLPKQEQLMLSAAATSAAAAPSAEPYFGASRAATTCQPIVFLGCLFFNV